MKRNSRDIWLMVLLVLIILGVWLFMYSRGNLDESLPDIIKKENVDKKVEKIKNILSVKKEKELKKDVVNENSIVVLETNKGNIEIELYKKLMPITAGNFEKLVSDKFYDGVRFHRVIKDFMIQGGDPNSKDLSKKNIWGQGGPGYSIKDEFIENEKLTNNEYTIAMANSGPQTGGSQFFINTENNNFLDFNKQPLQSKHPVFGKVVKGFDVVDKIENSKNGSVIIEKAYLK